MQGVSKTLAIGGALLLAGAAYAYGWYRGDSQQQPDMATDVSADEEAPLTLAKDLLVWNVTDNEIKPFGIGPVIGGAYFFTPRWSLDLEVGYAYVPTDDIVTHEVSAALAGAYHF